MAEPQYHLVYSMFGMFKLQKPSSYSPPPHFSVKNIHILIQLDTSTNPDYL